MSGLPPRPPYKDQSRQYVPVALLVALSVMGYIIIDRYNLASGGSNMVTVINKREIIHAPHPNNNQNTSTIMNQKSDTTNKKKIINQVEDLPRDR